MVTSAHRVGSAVGESTGAGLVRRQYSVPATTQPSPWNQAVFDLNLSASSEFSCLHIFPLLSENQDLEFRLPDRFWKLCKWRWPCSVVRAGWDYK